MWVPPPRLTLLGYEPADRSFHILPISKELRAFRLWSIPHPDTNKFGNYPDD